MTDRSDHEEPRFADRAAAGRALAARLGALAAAEPLVLALPRGGIEVAAPIAQALRAPLDVLVACKLRAPRQPELAMGALAEGGIVVWNDDVVAACAASDRERAAELARGQEELAARVAEYRAGRARTAVAERVVVLVDDGVATGATLDAAIDALARERVARLIVALPGGPRATLDRIARRPEVEQVVALAAPMRFRSVGELYDDFEQVASARVRERLDEAAARRRA